MLTFDELCETIKYSGYYLFPDDVEQALLDLIPAKYSKIDGLHYCWSHFEPYHRLELKIKPTNEFYLKMEESLFHAHDMLFLAIDADCIMENRLMLIEAEKLFSILKKYYWELDEIYIVGMKYNWLISVNHIFEFNLIGEELIKAVKERILGNPRPSFVLDMTEYGC